MTNLAQQVLRHATSLPEGASLSAKALLHLGSRAAVDQALSRLARNGELLRAGRGVYVLPVKGKFGARAPEVSPRWSRNGRASAARSLSRTALQQPMHWV